MAWGLFRCCWRTQWQGIGSALIREGHSKLEATNARGCCLAGHQEYYDRFGFEHPKELEHEGVPQAAFFALSFDGRYLQGTVEFHEAFVADSWPESSDEPPQGV